MDVSEEVAQLLQEAPWHVQRWAKGVETDSETSKIASAECNIGVIFDVIGSKVINLSNSKYCLHITDLRRHVLEEPILHDIKTLKGVWMG